MWSKRTSGYACKVMSQITSICGLEIGTINRNVCVSLLQLFLSGICSSDWFFIFVMSGIKSLVCKMSVLRKYTYLGQFMARRKYDIVNVLLWCTNTCNHSALGCGDYAPPSTIKAKSIFFVLPFVSWERLAVPSIFRLQPVGPIYHHVIYML